MIDDEPNHVQEDRVQKENASDTVFIKFEQAEGIGSEEAREIQGKEEKTIDVFGIDIAVDKKNEQMKNDVYVISVTEFQNHLMVKSDELLCD